MLQAEERTFSRTLERGLRELQRLIEHGDPIDGSALFWLFETHGLPPEVAVGAAEPPTPVAPGMREIRIRDRADPVPAAIWSRAALTLDTRVPGPAIIEQSDTTILVEPGWTARVGGGGALLLERAV